MKPKKYQTVEVNGKKKVFNLALFQETFIYMAKSEGKRIQEYEKILSDILFVNDSTIHNWRQNRNCPGSLDLIQGIADYWSMPVERLLSDVEEPDPQPQPIELVESVTQDDQQNSIKTNSIMTKLEEIAHMMNTDTVRPFTDREKDAVKRIYDKLLDYLEAFKETCGFQADMNDTPEDEFAELDDQLTALGEKMIQDLRNAVRREYIDLKSTVYDEIKFFIDNDPCRDVTIDLFFSDDEDEQDDRETADKEYQLDEELIDENPEEDETEEELSEEEKEARIIEELKEEDRRFFFMVASETLNRFYDIIDPYL